MRVRLDGHTLTIPDLASIATGATGITLSAAALAFTVAVVGERHAALREARARWAVHGANTGVGAADHPGGHAVRLSRSHCAGVEAEEDDVTARAVMAVRLHQILTGGSGDSRRAAETPAIAVDEGAVPGLHRWAAAAPPPHAELFLRRAGARPSRHGHGPVTVIDATDARPMISSSALTVATSALASRRSPAASWPQRSSLRSHS
ncbi:aromatic amino acid lyase [Actinoplanes sp. NEAU-A12]|uniref:Aromatic amino acid lyase n=1 Tax=Actinoplanes sandaracinus TaxID=3045177 RepID=A0ABT6WQV3_9ACTN|nr:aromatic amino acid lyase [Actinoplanes sandaracinus]MDI6102105.1 aromatic amino acid lyase [Actinoplanes sandaracinus]